MPRLFTQRRFIPVIVLGGLILTGTIWYLTQPSNAFRAGSDELRASGTIEAERVSVIAELGGRVVEILAREGALVDSNAVLARLDSESAAADLVRAEAAQKEAVARRDLARNGARAEDKAQADAALAQATAARDGARRAWDALLAIMKNPQELDAKIGSARTQVALASQQIELAKAQKAQADAARDRYRSDGSDLGKTLYASYDLQAQGAQESILAATAQRDGAQAALDDLLATRANPIDLQTQGHQAQARYREAEAAAQMAQAARDLLYAGATKEDLAIAEAAVAHAQAAVHAAQARLDKLSLRAPASGSISVRSLDLGEVIAPGTSAFSIVNGNRVTLTVYCPEDRVGRILVGQAARVYVDAFPQRVFNGSVTFISPQAEFTPRNVQTVEGRRAQVFAVKIRLDNSDGSLKPGMPADAVIR